MSDVRRIQVHEDGIIYLPEDWRRELGIGADDLVGISVEAGRAVLTKLDPGWPGRGDFGNDS